MPYEKIYRSGEGMHAIRNSCLLLALLVAFLPDLRLYADTWNRKENVPTPRGGAAACVLDGKIWLIGGNTSQTNLGAVNIFDPTTNSWNTVASLPTPRGNIAATVVNGQIYTFGGGLDVLSKSVEVFNPATNRWTVKDTMPIAWKGAHAVVYNGIVYLMGGSTRSDSDGDSLCYAFNPATGAWTELAPRPEPGPCGTALYRGEIYTFGSHRSLNDPAIPAVLILNPKTNTWRRGSDMPTPRTGLQAYLVKGKIYVIGGWQVRDTAVASVEVYDPLNDSWEKRGDMPMPLCFYAGAEVDGKIYVMGGSCDWESGGERTYEYDPAPASVTEKWHTDLAGIPTDRGGASASVVDGKIYLIGGSTAQTNLAANEVFDPATNSWQAKKPMPTARGFHAAAVVDGVIYTFGGALNATSNVVEAYSPATDSWSTKNNLPVAMTAMKAAVKDGLVYILGLGNNFTDLSFLIYNPATDTYATKTPPPAATGAGLVLYRGLIYTFGGGGWSNATTPGPVSTAVCAYDPATDTWSKKADMPTARAGLQAYLLNGKIFVMGGFQVHNSALATVEVYDPLKDNWQTGKTMPHSLCYFAGAEVDGRLYVLGGTEDWWNGGQYNDAYDPNYAASAAMGHWTPKKDVPTARGGASASIINGKIYLIGGSTAQIDLAANEMFDPVANTWQTKAPMPTARGYHASAVINGLIYTLGGGLNAGSTNVEVYNPATNTWTTKKPLPFAWSGANAAVVNGIVYCIGGMRTDSICYAYDPVAESFTAKTPRPGAGGGCAVVAYNNLIYTFGGGGWSTFTTPGPVSAAVRVYDPRTDTWTKKADMPTPREGAAAVLVDGKIYVTGGFQAQNSSVAAVEVYSPATDKWELKPNMTQQVCYHAGAQVNSKMYIMGGSPDWWSGGVANLEYDPYLSVTTGMHGAPSVVRSFELYQNYPNPFNPSTTIRFSLRQRSHVTLLVYNVLGQKVAELANGDMTAGTHEVRFNATNLASGVYLYRLQSGEFSQTRSLLLLK